MSHPLINRSPDLKKLQDKGYEVQVQGALLLVHHIPYLNSKIEPNYGTLVSKLVLAGEITARPEDHVIYFIGEHPCHNDGTKIKGIEHETRDQPLDGGLVVNHSFSNKPAEGYSDYYEKVTRYVEIISAPAKSIDPNLTAKTFKPIESNDIDSVFYYLDTNSSRAEITAMSAKLENLKIAIIGLGGTGSYILDFVAKMPVKEIHIFDADIFLQHNAFRAPGAAHIEKLNEQPKKVNYLAEIYSKLHKYIFVHDQYLTPLNLEELTGMDFVFICIDDGESKKMIIERLIENQISFVDTGIGISLVDDKLTGAVRVTVSTPEKNDHINQRISFSDIGNDEYSQNIQVAEINALNASLAVIKWKKLYGYYHDLGKEYNSSYEININKIIND